MTVTGGIAGGRDRFVAEAELYDPQAQTFSRVSSLSGSAGRMQTPTGVVGAIEAAAVRLRDGRVLICGGYGVERPGRPARRSVGRTSRSSCLRRNARPKLLQAAFLFDPRTNTFSRVGDLKRARCAHTATLLEDGRVLIAGWAGCRA